MRLCASLFRGVAAPPGCVIFFRFCRNCGLYALRSGAFRVCEEMFSSWGRALNYLKSRDLADLSDLIENDLIEPEYAGYVPADDPCCPDERCCEYAERMEREYTAEREADEDNEDADVFEYDGEPAISELTGVCRDILTAVEGLTTLLRDEFDYAG